MYRTFNRQILSEPEGGFFSAFPVPDFLAMASLGFDISDDSIKAIELLEAAGAYEVGFYASKDIPKETIEGGEVLDPTRLQRVVAEMQREHRFIFVKASLPEQKAYLFTTTVEVSRGTPMRQKIEEQLEENVPLSQDEIVFDYKIYRTYKKKNKTYKDVRVSAISRTHSESYISLLKRSGLRPISLTIEAEAITRAVVPEGDKDTYMIMDLGKARTGISIVSEGVTRYTYTSEVGGSQLTEHIANKLNLSFEEAEERKHASGLTGKNEEARIVSEASEEKLDVLAKQINDVLRYWHSQVDERGVHAKRVNAVILCGGGALMKGLPAYIQNNFSIEAALANVWSNVPFRKHYVPSITFEDSLSYAAAIGLALE
ncbi:MAG: pilus assembly protein PilM [Candidatus Campbellbacteria bacterium]|nr:pilus assembly protein PilM [Candidatus Campbellbacteria bacterium]